MKSFPSVVFYGLCLAVTPAIAQDLSSSVQTMQSAYAASGNIVLLSRDTIMIEPHMPAPLCALPKDQNGTTTWSLYTFPLASITVPLAQVDETLIAEDRVFSSAEALRTYKPGQVGDSTMVVVAGVRGKQFHTLIYDLDKFEHLGPGPHSSKDYDQAPDDTVAFGLTFADPAAAHAFAVAFRNAVMEAKAQAAVTERP
ncbi:MAG: hypothetical protein WAK26_14040 [Terracidiphilus sp.]